MSNARNPKLQAFELTEAEFKVFLSKIPDLSDKQFNILCNDVFAETMEREEGDIMDPPSFDDDLPWNE